MSNIDLLKTFSNEVKGEFLTIKDKLYALSKNLRSSIQDKVSALAEYAACILAIIDHDATSLGTAMHNIFDLNSDEDVLISGIGLDGLTTIPIEIKQTNWDEITLSNGDVDIAYLRLDDTDPAVFLTTIDNFVNETGATVDFTTAKQFINDTVVGVSDGYFLSEICDTAGQLDWGSDLESAKNTVLTAINNFKNPGTSLKQTILNAVAAGPEALFGVISSIYQGVGRKYGVDQQDVGIFSDSITVDEFSYGLVWGTIGAGVSAISLALTAVSRVLAAITAITGAAISFIANIASNISQAITGTKFTVHPGRVNNCFSFVVNRYTCIDSTIYDTMVESGVSSCTISSTQSPVVYLCYIIDDDTKTIYCEEHVSTQFALFSTSRQNQYWMGGCLASANADLMWRRYNGGYPDQPGIFLRPDFSLARLCEDCLAPIDLNIYEAAVNVLSDKMELSLYDRLLSGMLLWTLAVNSHAVDTFCSTARAGIGSQVSSYLGYGWSPCFLSLGVSLASQMASMIISFFHLFGVATSLDLDLDPGVDWVNRDDLITEIENLFDGLLWRKSYDDGQQPRVPASSTGMSMSIFYGSMSSPTYSDFVFGLTEVSVVNQFISASYAAYYLDSTQSYHADINRTWYYTQSWYRVCSVDLPSQTFSAYLSGLVLDCIILGVIAIAAVAAVVGARAINNKRARLQAQAESDWYAYGNATTSEAKDAAWKKYKSSRLKYNILATATGASTLSVGLMDESSSPDSSYDGFAFIGRLITG